MSTSILIKRARIVAPGQLNNGKTTDILIENGIITKMADSINHDHATVYESPELMVSPGFMDLHAHLSDPGYEFKETLESGAAAAAAGGYTAVLAMPDNNPVTHSKSQVEYIIKRSAGLPCRIYPAGAVTVKLEGKELAEMYDMHQAGAIAFTDADHPIAHAGVLLRALQYSSNFGARIHVRCEDPQLAYGGQMNEGVNSTKLGLKGIPAVAEEVMLADHLAIAEYAQTPIHIMAVSSAGSVELIRNAKKKGLPVTAAVHATHLLYTDDQLTEFDTNFKLSPPLRTETDRNALIEGVLDGTIDCITSGHRPEDTESKVLEFDLATPGMNTLETNFSILCAGGKLKPEQMVNALSINPRKVTGLTIPQIEIGQIAELTLFDFTQKWIYGKDKAKSKGMNSPLFDKELQGVILGTIC
jgi:dihydroorotase